MGTWSRWLARKTSDSDPGHTPDATRRPHGPRPVDASGTYADDPLHDLHDDILGRARFAERVCNVLGAVADQTDSAVVALVGPWGSGKSTLLHAVENRATATDEWHVARYNPWSFSSLDGAVTGFFAELRAALPDDALGTSRRAALGDFAARVAPIGVLGGVVGVDATEPLRELARTLHGDRSPERLRDDAAKQLRSLDRPVLVLIDDLDRLEPAELLVTFKLVRLLGRLPNLYYVLSYDETTLEAVLQRTDLVGTGRGRARDYLEKMVQVRIDIPPLLPEQRLELVDRSLQAFLVRHEVSLSADDTSRLHQLWHHCIGAYLEQPRSVKRLFAQLDAMWPEVAGEVDVIDFLAMTFLRTFEQPAYELVLEHKEELTASPIGLFGQEEESHAVRWNRWESNLRQTEVRRPEAIAILLAELFLPIRSARENMTYGSDWKEQTARRRGVGSAEFFDRYSQLGVPAADVSDALIADAVAGLGTRAMTPAVEEVRARMASDAALVVRKLERLADGDLLPPSATIEFLAEGYADARRQKSGMLGLSPALNMLSLSMRLLDRLPPEDAAATLSAISQFDSGLELAIDAVRKASLAEERARDDHEWLERAASDVIDLAERRLNAATTKPISSDDSWLIGLLWGIRQLLGSGYVQEFVWTTLLREGSLWLLEDLLGLMVPVGTASDGRSSWEAMGDFGASSFEDILGLERVLEYPIAQPQAAPFVHDFERRRAPVTLEARRDYALSVVAHLQRNSSESADSRRAESETVLDVTSD